MTSHFILTAAGGDRPGIVAAVAAALTAGGYDIEDSAMTILRGRFTMMLAVTHSEARSPDELERSLAPAAGRLDLKLHVDAVAAGSATPHAPEAFIITVSGANRLGIVARVAGLLAERGINITDLATRLLPAGPVPGYVMQIEAEAAGVDLEALRRELSRAGAELGVEVRIDRLETAEL